MLYICFTQNLSTPSLANHCLFVFSYLDGTARLANHRCRSSGWYRKVSCRLYYCKSIISSQSINKYIPLNLKHFAKCKYKVHVGRVKLIWYLSPMRAAKVQASLRICAVSPESPLLAHTSSESRGTFRQKARSLAPLNGWACAVKCCHDGMLEDTNSLDVAHVIGYIIVICYTMVHASIRSPR